MILVNSIVSHTFVSRAFLQPNVDKQCIFWNAKTNICQGSKNDSFLTVSTALSDDVKNCSFWTRTGAKRLVRRSNVIFFPEWSLKKNLFRAAYLAYFKTLKTRKIDQSCSFFIPISEMQYIVLILYAGGVVGMIVEKAKDWKTRKSLKYLFLDHFKLSKHH